MAATVSATGRSGTASIRGTALGIRKWTGKVTKQFADSTDSNTYNVATGQTWQSQAPGTVALEGSIEGYFDTSGITDTNVIQLFNTDGPYAATLGLNRTQNFATGNFDFTDVEVTVEVPGATMITWTCNFKSNGTPTLY